MVGTLARRRTEKAGGCVRLTVTVQEWRELLAVVGTGRSMCLALRAKLAKIEQARVKRDGERYPGEAG